MRARCSLLFASTLTLLVTALVSHPDSSTTPRTIHRGLDGSISGIDVLDVSSPLQVRQDGGEKHDKIKVPEGSILGSIPANKTGDEEAAVFQSRHSKDGDIEHVYVTIHGKLRNGDEYWETMDKAVETAKKDGIPGANRASVIIAPQFFSTKLDSGQYEKNQLAWDDLNDWEDGGVATHPQGTTLTSIDVLDAIVDEFSNSTKYPSMRNVTIFGHGGGGQLALRYAAIATEPASHIHVRYIHGDPSTGVYFTDDRPTLSEAPMPRKESCRLYNTWRYGFERFPAALGTRNSVKEFFRQYISRDVVSLVGYRDTEDNGDQSCMARMQGGDVRRDRNLIWYKYINTLARTDVDVDGFPGSFHSSLPDWSDMSNNSVSLRLVVVESAGHNAEELFASDSGRSALFSDENVEVGWRPKQDGPARPDDHDDEASGASARVCIPKLFLWWKFILHTKHGR